MMYWLHSKFLIEKLKIFLFLDIISSGGIVKQPAPHPSAIKRRTLDRGIKDTDGLPVNPFHANSDGYTAQDTDHLPVNPFHCWSVGRI
jgi:hypothetical protein